MVWIGGGYFGRWNAISFDEIKSVQIYESDKAYTARVIKYFSKPEKGNYTVYKDSLKDLVTAYGEELQRKLTSAIIN